MIIDLIENIDGFRRLEPEWNGVLERNRHDNPFMTFEWLLSYLEVYGHSVNLFVVVVREGSRILALAPLMINEKQHLVFIGYPHNDYADIIVSGEHPSALDAVCSVLITHRHRWKKIILDQMHEDRSHWKELRARLEKQERPFRILLSDSCPAMVLDDIAAARKKYYKRNITTYVNWYEAQGRFAFNIYNTKDEALARLEDLFAQHIERRDQTPFPSQFTSDSVRALYRRFIDRMYSRNWVLLSSLTLDDKFLALYLAFRYRDTLYLYTTSFNGAYWSRSPGQVILRYLFDYCVEHGIRQMDFARGGEGYKDRFSNVVRQNRKFIVYNTRLALAVAKAFHAFRYSRLVDRLYRNRRVQGALNAYLYAARKDGRMGGIYRGLVTLITLSESKGGGRAQD
ncbi:MAG: GNAT family N-acetyltransferase [Candidatus Zixiibacteriota bacterium]